jgi:pimeloyl-ACP methyl ester carboxylesterase
MRTRTRYARNGDVSLAYEMFGSDERDILVTIGWVASMEAAWGNPAHARWLERLGGMGRVIMWDKRGTGLFDRVASDRLPTLEERMDDMRAVMDAADSERAILFGISEGAPMGTLFGARHPDRAESLVLLGGFARTLYDDDYPWGFEAPHSSVTGAGAT